MSKYTARAAVETNRRITFQGIPIVIDRPKGTILEGVDAKGAPWRREYTVDYGFIPRTKGGDGEGLDVFVGDEALSPKAFWITQHRDDGAFDEFKLFVGYSDARDVLNVYQAHVPARFFGGIREGTVQQIRALLGKEPTEPKRLADFVFGGSRSSWTGIGCDLCGFGSVEDVNRFDETKPCPECGTVNVALDLGVGDVHLPGAGRYRRGAPTAPPETKQMAKLKTEERKELPDSAFALPKERKYPIADASHVRNAASRLEEEKKAGKISSGDYNAAKRRIARAAKRFGVESEYNKTPKGTRIRVHAHIGEKGFVHVRHMSEGTRFGPTVELAEEVIADAAIALADGEKPKLVWIQLATSGQFAGHPQGPFELNDGIFRQIITNFEATKNHEVPIDFNHASEQDPTSGSIPERGTPAQGWIKELRIQGAQLMALVEWGDLAREYIKGKKYKYISPAIRFASKDRVTGRATGARLTSAGLTNQPFLDGMQPLAASDAPTNDEPVASLELDEKGEPVITLAARYAHTSGEYMPRVKAVLGLPELATARDCGNMLGNLREHFAVAGGDPDGSSGGVQVGGYMRGLRSLVNAPMGTTWDEVFDVVEDLIDAALEEHELKFHGAASGVPSQSTTSSDDVEGGEGDLDMSDKDLAQTLSDTQSKLTTASTQLSEVQTKLSTEQNKTSELTLQLSAASTKATSLETENAALKKQIDERDTKELEGEVDDAIRTYADTKGAKPEMRPHLLSFAKSNREGFRAMYPKVEADKRHLLQDLTGGKAGEQKGAPVATQYDLAAVSLDDVAARIATERKIPFAEAQIVAFNLAYGQ